MNTIQVNVIKGRKEQIMLLKGLFREGDCLLPSNVFLYGHAGTGKTLVALSVLQELNVTICHLNCVEMYSQKILYESVLNKISGTKPCKENKYASYSSCDNFNDFCQSLFDIYQDDQQRMAVLLEHSERLRDMDANIMPALCKLQELSKGVNICVIFMSRLPIDKFYCGTSFLRPLVIKFPQYTKDELVLILQQSCPNGVSQQCYNTYLSLFLSVFHLATRSITELMHLAQLNFKTYYEPISRGETSEDDLRQLWRNIEPHLKRTLQTVYLRQVSSEQFLEMQNEAEKGMCSVQLQGSTKIELPFYSKFLLIASYLASYNPANSDKRFFMKNHGKTKKTKAMIKAKQRTSTQLIGPKSFPLDRMMAIFYSIIQDRVFPTARIFSQLRSLVTLGLLTQVSADDALDSPKYKCIVSLEFIKSISRTVSFDIIEFLYEFAGK